MCGYLDVPAVEGADDVDLGVAALVLLVHNVDDVVRVVDPETEHGIKARAGNEPSRSLKFHNHTEGLVTIVGFVSCVLNEKALLGAFNQEQAGPSRGLLCDCEISNFTKVRFQL